MKLPYSWLSDYTDIGEQDIKSYCDRMTITGSKVEGYEVLCEEISNVVIGRVESIERHGNSDHMWVCMVNVDCSDRNRRAERPQGRHRAGGSGSRYPSRRSQDQARSTSRS